MKNLAIIVLLLFTVSCTANLASDETQIVTFDTSITCNDCVNKMFNTLPKEKGVIDLKVGLDEKTVTVVFNSIETNVDKLAEKINELGYSALVKSLTTKQ